MFSILIFILFHRFEIVDSPKYMNSDFKAYPILKVHRDFAYLKQSQSTPLYKRNPILVHLFCKFKLS